MVKDKSKFLVYCLLLTSFTVGLPCIPYGVLGAEVMLAKEFGKNQWELQTVWLFLTHVLLFILLFVDRKNFLYQTALWLFPLMFVVSWGLIMAIFFFLDLRCLLTLLPFLVFWIILMVREYILYPQGDQEL